MSCGDEKIPYKRLDAGVSVGRKDIQKDNHRKTIKRPINGEPILREN
jgi:hypothetical protein